MSIKQWSAKGRGDRLQNGKALNAIQNATWDTEKKILEKKETQITTISVHNYFPRDALKDAPVRASCLLPSHSCDA